MVSYYNEMISQWSEKKEKYEEYMERLRNARSSYHSLRSGALSDHIQSYRTVYKKLDGGNKEGDWEGNQKKNVEDLMKENITSPYAILKENHSSVSGEISERIKYFDELKDEAQEQIDQYISMRESYIAALMRRLQEQEIGY